MTSAKTAKRLTRILSMLPYVIANPGVGVDELSERVLTKTVEVGDRDAVLLEDGIEGGLVGGVVDGVDALEGPVATPVEGQDLAVLFDVEEPRRPPADLPLGAYQGAAGGSFDPLESALPFRGEGVEVDSPGSRGHGCSSDTGSL